MEADDVNWDPIFEMMPTQEMDDYEDRMKSVSSPKHSVVLVQWLIYIKISKLRLLGF